MLLREHGVDTVILTGLHTNICVRHTAADAFYRGYRVIVPTDAVEAFTAEDHEDGLEYLKKVYGAELSSVDELLGIMAEQPIKV
jgi:nicotinamidase-related amidase